MHQPEYLPLFIFLGIVILFIALVFLPVEIVVEEETSAEEVMQ
ncbi:MAG: hypothetical protein ABIQ40_07065 [Bacteroidia bacterium]